MPPTLRLVIEDDEGHRQVVPFAADELTVGRAPAGNGVRLPERNVSRRHARFLRVNGSVFVEDLGSSNGTLVNGQRVEGRRRLREGDLVQIGDYDLAVEGAASVDDALPRADLSERPTAPALPALPPPLPSAGRPEPPPALPAAREPAVAPPPAPRPAAPPLGALARRAWIFAAIGLASLALGFAAGRLLRGAAPARPLPEAQR